MLDRHRIRFLEEQRNERLEPRPLPARALVIVRRHALVHAEEPLGVDVRRRENPAVGAVGEHRVEPRVVAGQHGESLRAQAQQLDRLREVARGVLHADDVRQLPQPQQRLVREVDARAVGNVVDQDPLVGRLGDPREVLPHPVLARPVVVRAHRDDARERVTLEALQGLQDLRRRVAADADEHRHAPRDEAHGAIDDRLHLVLVDRRPLARRSQREHAAHAPREVVREHPVVAREVDAPVHERRDDRQPDP